MRYFALVLILTSMSVAWGNGPGDGSTNQPSLMMSSSLVRKSYWGIRYEKGPAPEFKGSANEMSSAERSGTYGIQYGSYFFDRLMLGVQVGPILLPFPLFPTGHVQYDFYRGDSLQFSLGGFSGIFGHPYGAGLTGSFNASHNWRVFVSGQWISDAVTYESAIGNEHDNFVSVDTEYSLLLLGTEIVAPKYENTQMSFSVSVGYQDYLNYSITSEDHPSDFKFHDGLSAYIEVKFFLD
ncbi:hypothetical protein [Bdellovibrio sp. HCB209]|uniref:hypothetical protein n=1 Tax=Bdellovibrio sp. HCB209 TaxID=3394354 RepID=UPI0039B6971F